MYISILATLCVGFTVGFAVRTRQANRLIAELRVQLSRAVFPDDAAEERAEAEKRAALSRLSAYFLNLGYEVVFEDGVLCVDETMSDDWTETVFRFDIDSFDPPILLGSLKDSFPPRGRWNQKSEETGTAPANDDPENESEIPNERKL